MKRIVSIIAAALCTALCAAASPIYKYENTENITDTVSLTTVREFHEDKNISYSYIKADLTDPRIDLSLLKSRDGVDVLKTVSQLAEENPDTLAAVNGDFFSWYSGNKGFSLGIEKVDKKLEASPINPDTMATVAYDGDSVLMSYLDFHIMVVAPNWQYKEIRHLNKHTTYYGDILMYTSSFNGGFSPAPQGEVVEMVVEDGKVKEFRRNMPPVRIPDNGCVLVVSEGVTTFLSQNFAVGDSVKFDYYITPSLDEYDTAFGGGAIIVSNGQDVGKIGDYSHTVSGNNPRTAIGVDESGTTLYLVTVDGRSSESSGMKMSALAELMIELGCYTAVNLDGGGSTRMEASTLFEKEMHPVNNPTENRKVINAVGITLNESAKDAKEAGVELRSSSSHALVGQGVKIDAVVYDSNKRQMSDKNDEIILSCDKGSITGGVLVSNVPGRVTVTAAYGGLSGSICVDYIENVSGISAEDSVKLDAGESKEIPVSVFDSVGRTADIYDYSIFEITSSDPEVAVFENGKIKALKNGTAVIYINKGNVQKCISVAVGEYTYNYYNGFENDFFSFVSYPKTVKGSCVRTSENKFSGNYSAKLSYDFTTPMTDESGQPVSMAAYCALNIPVRLDDDCSKIYMNVNSNGNFRHSIRAQFTDGKGKIAIVPFEGDIVSGTWRGIAASIPTDFARPLTLTRIYVLYTPGEENDKSTVFLDDLSFAASEAFRNDETAADSYRTDVNNSNVTSTLRIGAIPSSENKTPLTSYFENRVRRYVTSYGSGAFVGEGIGGGISSDERNIYVRIDASKGGIRKTDSSQWTSLKKALENMTQKNVFILSDSDIFGKDELENSVICDFLSECGKNVFVVTAGEGTAYKNIKGVHYFTLDNTPENCFFGMTSKHIGVVEFYLGDKVTFEFISV